MLRLGRKSRFLQPYILQKGQTLQVESRTNGDTIECT